MESDRSAIGLIMHLLKLVQTSSVALVLSLSPRCMAGLPEDPVEYRKWEEQMLAVVAAQEGLSPESAIPRLGKWVMQMALPNNREHGDRPVFKAAQTALLAIPGHAEHFGNIARGKFEEEIARKESDRERMWAFETLEQLPGPETVKVLGELLYDDRNPWDPKDFYDTGPPIPNFKRASMALTRLGIKKAPVKSTNPYRSGFEDTEDHTWKLWYEQVRDGSRTFSFEGNEAVYNLSGPVSEKTGPVPSRPDRRPSSTLQQTVPTSRAPLAIAMILLAGIAAFAVSKMKRASGDTR